MIERTVPPIEPLSADDVAQAAEASALAKRPPGRPKGTDYRRVDAPLHAEMRRLLERGEVPTLTAAAWAVAARAYGKQTEEASKVARLVKTYPYPYSP